MPEYRVQFCGRQKDAPTRDAIRVFRKADSEAAVIASIKRDFVDVYNVQVMEISKFARGYIECALWASELDDVSVYELPYATLSALVEDAREFRESFSALLDLANVLGRDDEQLGHDFWLTRNRHGAGFWDRGLGAIGDSLTEYAHPYGERDLYRGDDGFVYVA